LFEVMRVGCAVHDYLSGVPAPFEDLVSVSFERQSQ